MNPQYNELMFDRDVMTVARQLKESGLEFSGIYPIPRGGIALGVALAYILGLPLVGDPLQGGAMEELPDRVLVADDLIDTGTTLQPYLDLGYQCVVLCKKPRSPFPGNGLFFATSMPTNDWIDFFWEKNDVKS